MYKVTFCREGQWSHSLVLGQNRMGIQLSVVDKILKDVKESTARVHVGDVLIEVNGESVVGQDFKVRASCS